MIDKFTADDFTSLIGQTVLFDTSDYKEAFTISEVDNGRVAPPKDQRRGFTVFMDGSNPAVMIEQGLYPLEIPELGRHELFIGCVGKTQAGAFRYQMVFN